MLFKHLLPLSLFALSIIIVVHAQDDFKAGVVNTVNRCYEISSSDECGCSTDNIVCENSDVVNEVQLLPSIRDYPIDLSKSEYIIANTSAKVENAPCAKVHSIKKTLDFKYEIEIDISLDGNGCNMEIPWHTAPKQFNEIIYGENALQTCDLEKGGCDFITKFNHLKIEFDTPIYRFPIQHEHSRKHSKNTPFGYAGYYTYDTRDGGICSKYGFDVKSQNPTESHTFIDDVKTKGIALFATDDSQCFGDRPTSGAFKSYFDPRSVSARVAGVQRNLNFLNENYLDFSFGDFEFNATDFAFGAMDPMFNYLNATSLFGIERPFLCGEEKFINSSRSVYQTGIEMHSAHSCPMGVSEWDAILPDVLIEGVTVDNITVGRRFGNEYTFEEHVGKWNIPDRPSDLPLGFFRCSSNSYSSKSNFHNVAKKHYPITTSFGPNCAALEPISSAQGKIQTAIGGHVKGVTHDGKISDSAAFPVRIIDGFDTQPIRSAIHDVFGVKLDPVEVFNATIEVYSGISKSDFNFNPDFQRYIFCNGGESMYMAQGVNSTSGFTYGSLIELIDNATTTSKDGPIYANFYQTHSPASLKECYGCTFPTFSHQKGWTVISTPLWQSFAQKTCGNYHVDQSLHTRIMDLVNVTEAFFSNNQTYVDTEADRIFALMNDDTNALNKFLDAAKGHNFGQVLDESETNILLSKVLSRIGIDGIGTSDWIRKFVDANHHGCRPTPDNSNGQSGGATPLCSLFKNQLYHQQKARLNATLSSTPTRFLNGVFSSSMQDLQSAYSTGGYNLNAPNFYFGQGTHPDGYQGWYAFFTDSWDRNFTKSRGISSIYGSDGMAKPVKLRLKLDFDVVGTHLSNYVIRYDTIAIFNQGRKACSTDPLKTQVLDINAVFEATNSGVNDITFKISATNCKRFTFSSKSIILYRNQEIVEKGKYLISYDDVENTLSLSAIYDTFGEEVVFAFEIPYKCSEIADTNSPIDFTIDYGYTQFYEGKQYDIHVGQEKASCNPKPILDIGENGYYLIYDMSAIKVPDNLPYLSDCFVSFNKDTNPLVFGVTEYKSKDRPYTPTVAIIDPKINDNITWVCYSPKIEDTDPEIPSAQCNVSGAEGNPRTGVCIDIEDFLGQCDGYCDFSCTPWTYEQFGCITFITLAVLFSMVVLAVIILICLETKFKN